MKIAFINPPSENNVIRRWRCAVEQNHYLFPPMELCYLNAIAKDLNHETRIYDCIANKINYNKLSLELNAFLPELIVFMPGFETAIEDIITMKKMNIINAKYLAFGYYPSMFPNVFIEFMDYIIVGEPEETFREFLINNKLSNVKGLAWHKDKKIIINKPRDIIKNIDSILFPDYTGLDLSNYSSGFIDKKPFITIMTSRGCPFRCSYCVRSYGDNFRQRSVENVINEIILLIKKYNIKSLRILDDTFTVNKKWVMDFCDAIHIYGLQWSCLSRPETLDEQMINAMADAGCNRIMIGIESGSDYILKQYNRGYQITPHLKDKFILLRKAGIESFAFFMLGAPYEGEEDIKKSIAVAKYLDPDYITLNMMRLYPGTLDYNKYIQDDAVLSKEEVTKLMFKFYRSFYLRPSWIIRKLPSFIMHPIFPLHLVKEYLKWEIKGTNFGDKK